MSWTQLTEVEATPTEKLKALDVLSKLEASEKPNAESMTKAKKLKPKADPVNNPAHYTAGGIETIDYIQAKLTPEEFIGYLKGNVIKYTSRAGKKNDLIEDLEKAQWYMNRQIKTLKGESK
jgi:hypothetical protein